MATDSNIYLLFSLTGDCRHECSTPSAFVSIDKFKQVCMELQPCHQYNDDGEEYTASVYYLTIMIPNQRIETEGDWTIYIRSNDEIEFNDGTVFNLTLDCDLSLVYEKLTDRISKKIAYITLHN